MKDMKMLEVCIKLYDGKKGTMKEICRQCNIKSGDGYMYKVKSRLVSLGILKECGTIFNNNKELVVYKISKKHIDKFIFQTLPFGRRIYERVLTGEIDDRLF